MEIIPGNVVNLGDCIRTVIAILPDNKILTDVGEIRSVDEVLVLNDRFIDEIVVSQSAKTSLVKLFQLPDLGALTVGDGLLLFAGIKTKITVVAVIDRPRSMYFTADGDMIVAGSDVFKNGWHTEEKDLLTAKGYSILRNLY